MKGSAIDRKAAWVRENRADFHTVVVDDRNVFNANGPGQHDESQREYYYRRGFGSFRVGTMQKCSSIAEVKALIAMKTRDLPDAAKPSGLTKYPRFRPKGWVHSDDLITADFDESKHPRDAHGRFGSGDSHGEDISKFIPAKGSPSANIPVPKSDAEVPAFLAAVESSPEYKAISEALVPYSAEVRGGTIEGLYNGPGDVRAWSLQKYSQDGVMLPERQALHDRIAASMLNPLAVAPPGQQQAVMLMGPPGGGKSTAGLPEAMKLGEHWTVIAPDDVKAQLPGFAGWNASIYQEESSKIGEQDVTQAAMAANHNIIFDLTGANKEKMIALVENMSKAGYAVHLVNVEVDPFRATGRCWQRFVSSGRILPPRYSYEGVDSKPGRTYNILKQMPQVKSWTSVNTNGAAPAVTERGSR